MLEKLLIGLFFSGSVLAAQTGWVIPSKFPRPPVPAANPITPAKTELGRYLFYDKRMSINGSESCGSCHRQEWAFTDGRAQAQGATGELHPRSAMSLVNVAYAPALTWANPKLDSLEEQMLVPMYGHGPVELGLPAGGAAFLDAIQRDSTYQRLFPAAFPAERNPYTMDNVVKAIATFERSIVSMRSAYDRYRYEGDQTAISDAAKRGELLFFSSEHAGCFQCHGGWNFSGPVRVERRPPEPAEFHNTGLYNTPGPISYPQPNTGLYQYTGQLDDVGRFRPPTLRNIAVTAPYMHDGSIATLDEVIGHYAKGGRAGDNPNKSRMIHGFPLSPAEKQDLIAFLKSLTDEELLTDPRWGNPWN